LEGHARGNSDNFEKENSPESWLSGKAEDPRRTVGGSRVKLSSSSESTPLTVGKRDFSEYLAAKHSEKLS